MEQFLIMMTGLPGTGKTTSSSKIAAALPGYVLYSFRDVRREMGQKRYNPYRSHDVLLEIACRTESSLFSGVGVIVDSTFTSSKGRQYFYNIAAALRYGGAVIIETTACEKEAKRRMRARPKNDGLFTEPRNPAVYDALQEKREPVNLDFAGGANPHVSYVVYDTEKNEIERQRITQLAVPLIKTLEKILLFA